MRRTAMAVLALVLLTPSFAPAQDAAPSDSPAIYFASDIMPLLSRLGCNQTKCHGAATGRGGFTLSMFGADVEYDYAALTRQAAGRRVNRVEPAQSLFLLKATASIAHEGGKILEAGSPEYNQLVAWIARGAPFRDANAPALVSIQVEPSEKILGKGESQPIRVSAVFANDTRKDVTANALFSSNDEKVATVDKAGHVQAADFGETAVVVSYLRRFATARVTVPQPLPTPFPEIVPNNKIDELVFAKLKTLGIPPSDVGTDQEFVRRVYMDVIGTLPTADEARQFLADADPQKRSKLIDRLLACEEFGDYWALKWSDLFRMKSELPSNLWPNAVQAYNVWVKQSIAANKPYDQFVRELLTSSGSNFRVPPANFYRAMLQRTPQNLGESAALVFMGVRVGCARCHAHPSAEWTLDDNLGLSAFFTQVQYKNTREWKEEIVFLSKARRMSHPQTGAVLNPKFLGGAVVDLVALETAARDAATAATTAKAAATRAATTRDTAAATAAARRQQASEAQKKSDALAAQQPAPAAATLAAATQAYQAAETAAQEAETAAAKVKGEAETAAAAQVAAETDAAAKRQLADEKNAEDFRVVFAQWLTSPDNPWFTTNLVNRTWFWLLGRAIIHEADDIRSTNLPENPALLAYLEQELISHRFDLKHVYRLILNSKTYQLSFRPNPWNQNDVAHFSHYHIKRLGAETLLDAIGQVTGQWDTYRSIIPEPYVVMPTGFRATHLADGSVGVPFLEMFGRPPRDTAYEGDRDSQLYLRQTLHMLNSSDIQGKINASPRLAQLLKENTDDAPVIEECYLATVSRRPTDQEKQRFMDYRAGVGKTVPPQLEVDKKAADDALAQVRGPLQQATAAYDAAEKAAKEAEAAVTATKNAASQAATAQANAEKAAAAKRQQAVEAKKKLDDLVQSQQKPAEAKLAALVQAANDAAAAKAAEDALARINQQVAAATQAQQAAETVATEAETAAGQAKTAADNARAAQATAAATAPEKRKLATDAKAARDKVAADEKAASAKATDATRKLNDATAALKPRRDQAFQDLLWALINTKEFLFNH